MWTFISKHALSLGVILNAIGTGVAPMTATAQPSTRPAVMSAKITVHLDQPAKPISPDLFGIFFEDLNHSAEGGLYAELVRNRSFDFSTVENSQWNALTGWELIQRNGGRASVNIDAAEPIHPSNPTYAVLEVGDASGDVGLSNGGFDGIAVKQGETYDVALFARQLYHERRWGGRPTTNPAIMQPQEGKAGPLIARLETKEGEVIAQVSLALPPDRWTRLTATLTAQRTVADARLVLLMTERGGLAIDMVSLFPTKTFKDRANGLRADLAQAIADLKPKFVRFPGGCLVHGNGLGNAYNWKDTIGPIETRKGQPNLWRYHQSMGLGYYEYFQFCEDIGAKPLPVVPSGVSCKNSGYQGGIGQRAVPLEQMPAYIQDILDLIEWANGPADSTWGAKRAAAGHPEPFGLKYLGVGNEEHITPEFEERFEMIHNAIKAKHPEIVVIGTVGPGPSGDDYDKGWAFADKLKVPVVDEHYYESPEWFLQNVKRYDAYDRAKSKVYIGEYASRGNSLHNALAEAAYMTALERNGDVVQFASYAPLICKTRHVHWYPDLIYFDNERVMPSVNYAVQQMFSVNAGDAWIPHTLSVDGATDADPKGVYLSSVRESASGDVILKLVNVGPTPVRAEVSLGGATSVGPQASVTVLTGDPTKLNAGDPRAGSNAAETPMTGVSSTLQVGPTFTVDASQHSLTVVRLKTK